MKRITGELAPLEHEIQSEVIRLFESVGCVVIRFSERRRTRVTPGVADLKVYCPRKHCTWWWETKRPGGVQQPAQHTFQTVAQACGEVYLIGGTDAAFVHLRAIGLIAAPGRA